MEMSVTASSSKAVYYHLRIRTRTRMIRFYSFLLLWFVWDWNPASAAALEQQTDHNSSLLLIDLPGLMAASIFLFTGIILIFLSIYAKQRFYLYLGFFVLGMCAYALLLTNLTIVLYDNPAIWHRIKVYTEYLLPVLLYLFYDHLFDSGRITRLMWQIHFIFASVSILGSVIGIIGFTSTFTPFNLLVLITFSLMLAITVRKMMQGDYEAKVFMIGSSVFFITILHDVCRALGLFPNGDQWMVWGFVGFVSSLSWIVGIRFKALYMQASIQKQMETLDKLKDEFLANTSHELRTPLNGIIGIAESLLDGAAGPVSEPMRHNLSMIAASGIRLSNLVNDIQDFAKLKHKDLQLSLEPVHVQDVAETVIAFLRPLAEKKQLRLTSQMAGLPSVPADKDRLQQILYNLIGNAIKYTHEGEIEVLGLVEKGDVLIKVRDTGIGIPDEKYDGIFVPFEQVDGSASRSYDGTGLGLSITKHLIELHGGDIRLESRVGHGSTFTFTLPVGEFARTVMRPEPGVAESASPVGWMPISAPLPQQEEWQEGDEGTILIVEDDPINVQVIQNHLSLRNWGTMVTSNGVDALRVIEQDKIDLVLLDVMMPRMSGYEVCQRIREQLPADELPVIMLTAKSAAEDIAKGYESGANDYLLKPFTKMELLARIEAHLRLRALELQKAKSLLTKTEEEILSTYARYPGETRRQILERFNGSRKHPITEKTLATHITNILKKIKASNMNEAAVIATRKKLLHPPESTGIA